MFLNGNHFLLATQSVASAVELVFTHWMSTECSADLSLGSSRDGGDTYKDNSGMNNPITSISFSVKWSYLTQLNNSKYLIFS